MHIPMMILHTCNHFVFKYFNYHVAIAMLQNEWRHLIAGGTTTPKKLANPAPEWISERVWNDILTLPALPTFTKLAEEFSELTEGFKKIFDSVEPHREPLPGHWNTELDDFQKMLVLKCIRADKLTNSMQASDSTFFYGSRG